MPIIEYLFEQFFQFLQMPISNYLAQLFDLIVASHIENRAKYLRMA